MIMTIATQVLPIYVFETDDYPPVTAADISAAYDHADGSIYWTCQVSIKDAPPQQAVYHLVNGKSTRLPVQKTVTGRGMFRVLNGHLYLTAWNEAEKPKRGYGIPIPECRAPEILQVAQPQAFKPVVIPASSPLWQLWRGMKTAPDGSKQPYLAEDFDTDAEDALRVGRQLAAMNAMIDYMLQTGLWVRGS